MKSSLLHFLLFMILALGLGCEGCVQTPGSEECPAEPHGDFFIVFEAIEAAEPFLCPSADFPDITTWINDDIFTSDPADVTKYYVKIRVDGFCDNIGKTDPFAVVLNGVDDVNVQAASINGRRGFRIFDVPIDRQLTITVSIREPCQDAPCTFCEGQVGRRDYRMRFSAMQTDMNVTDLKTILVTLFGRETRCDCEM